MSVKKGYKQTEVGVIPEDWEFVELGEYAYITKLAGFEYSKYFNSYNEGGEIIVIRGTNITKNKLDLTDIKRIPKQVSNFLKRSQLNKNDLVFAYVGTIGPVYLIAENEKYHLGPNTAKIKVNSEILPKYAFTYFSSDFIKREIDYHTSIGAQPSLSMTKIRKFKIILPTLPEQKTIATALSDIDGLIDSLSKLIEKKKKIKKGAMQELLTGKKRLEGFSGEWEETFLSEIGKCLRGVSFKGSSDLYLTDNNNSIRLLRANNIFEGSINKDDLVFVKSERVAEVQIMVPNDILLCMASGSKELVGKSGLFKGIDRYLYTFGAFMGCFRTNAMLANPIFIYYLTQSDLYKKNISITLSGSSINNLKPSDIGEMLFSMPPYKEQTAIATILSDMDSEIKALNQKLNKFKNIKNGMMQELLTGRIRLLKGA